MRFKRGTRPYGSKDKIYLWKSKAICNVMLVGCTAWCTAVGRNCGPLDATSNSNLNFPLEYTNLRWGRMWVQSLVFSKLIRLFDDSSKPWIILIKISFSFKSSFFKRMSMQRLFFQISSMSAFKQKFISRKYLRWMFLKFPASS